MSTLSIDLVICTYNNAGLLDRTLDALARQEVPPSVSWRVLVVNNNCIDHTSEIVRRHVAEGRIPGLREILEARQGLVHARRAGVEHTTADWVAFVDDDCLLAADWVAEAAAFARRHPACGAIGGRVVLTWEVPPPAFVQRYGYAFAAQDHGDVPKEVECLVGAGMVVRREALYACGWMDRPYLEDRTGTKLVSGGDVEMALRIRGLGTPLLYNPACRLRHVIPPRRTSPRYLLRINFGLGASQLCGDAMLWSGSYRAWLPAFTRRTLRASYTTFVQTLRALAGRRSRMDAAMSWSFVGGNWAGLWKVMRMVPRQRRAFLGCAAVPPGEDAHRFPPSRTQAPERAQAPAPASPEPLQHASSGPRPSP